MSRIELMYFQYVVFQNSDFITDSFGTIRPPVLLSVFEKKAGGYSFSGMNRAFCAPTEGRKSCCFSGMRGVKGLPADQYSAPCQTAAKPGHHHQIPALERAGLL